MRKVLTRALMSALALLVTGPALGASEVEIFRDAARAGKLDLDALRMLGADSVECHLYAPRSRTLFCMSYLSDAEKGRWQAVFVDLRRGRIAPHDIAWHAADGAPDRPLHLMNRPLRKVNKQLRRQRWEETYPDIDATLPPGQDAEAALSDGRTLHVERDAKALVVRRGDAEVSRASLTLDPSWSSGMAYVYAPSNAKLIAILRDRAQTEPTTKNDSAVEVLAPGAKPADTKPAGAKPADTKPADTKPADTKPADTKPASG